MGKLINFPNTDYLRWEILQRLNELTKAIKREWTQKRQDEIDHLKEKLGQLKS